MATTLLVGMALGTTRPAGAAEWREAMAALPLSDDASKGWRMEPPGSVSLEPVEDGARLRETGPERTGTLRRRLPLDGADGTRYRFLQVAVGRIEDIEQGLTLVLRAEQGVEARGPLLMGTTTVDMAALPGYAESRTVDASLEIAGPPGVAPGGWLDLKDVRLTDAPADALTIALADAKTPGVAAVGDTLRLRLTGGAPAGERPRVGFYLTDGMTPHRFSTADVTLEPDGDGAWSADAPITDDAWRLDTARDERRGALLASVRVGGAARHALALFLFAVTTAHAAPQPAVEAKTPLVRQQRELWLERTAGENLALGKPVRFSARPDYNLTSKGGTDQTDLTDGKLSSRLDDRIWFASDTVGWYNQPSPVYNLLIDLGAVRPVDRVVARFLGGKEQPGLIFPKRIEAVVSEDGTTFHRVSALEKLMPGEKDQCDWRTAYFLEEDGEPYVYPFPLSVKTKARYVGLTVTGDGSAVFSDEVAVMAGEFEVAGVSYAGLEPVSFVMDGLIFRPAKTPLTISTNINTPNFFYVSDCRKGEARKRPVTYVIEMPAQIEMVQPRPKPERGRTATPFERDGRPWTRFELRLDNWPAQAKKTPFFLQLAAGQTLPAGAKAVFYAECEGVEPNRFEVGISTVEMPRVPPLKRLHVSLAWMGEHFQIGWPGFWEAWPALGFNAVSTFPRYWKDGKPDPSRVKFLDEARQHGFKVVYNESPFHVMENEHKKEKEIYSQFEGGKTGALCPSYRGRFYKEEIERVGALFAASRADYVFYDIECWYKGAREAGRCLRCQEGRKRSGKPMPDYLRGLGAEMWRDMREAIAAKARALRLPMPVIGSYNNYASGGAHHGVMHCLDGYPRWLDQSQPSLYVRGDARAVHNTVKADYAILKKRVILPWLSAGTYGEFPPYKLEYMILEALLNGACGITYYCYTDFDTALDFYYHAKALALLAPYENLLMDGARWEVKADNPGLYYSAWMRGGELLLLVGNYDRAPNGKTRIALPFARVLEAKELRAGAALPAAPTLELEVKPDDVALVYVKGMR
ncbi:MAG: hypothetical protein JXR37_18900 [Kiritimatiellae bacterium]|nr:hypothetical protein [Kiritimatiellia bacterium]